jgi:hypothetical protein
VRRGAAPTGQNDRMSRQPRGGGTGEVARGAGYAALLGALLIGVAVVIGIVLLQIGDRNDNGPTSTAPHATTTTRPRTRGTTRTTTSRTSTSKTPTISPGLLKVIVLNAGAATGQAGVMTSNLRQHGYTSVAPANDWTGHHQVGNSVTCRGGLGSEGRELALQVGPNVPVHIHFPKTFSPLHAGEDCVVVVGSTG